MTFSYNYKDKNGKTITSDISRMFLSEADFRKCRRKEMKKMPNVHYCEYYELNIPKARVKTIANF